MFGLGRWKTRVKKFKTTESDLAAGDLVKLWHGPNFEYALVTRYWRHNVASGGCWLFLNSHCEEVSIGLGLVEIVSAANP